MNTLATLYAKKNDFTRSLEIHQQVQSIVKNLLGDYHTHFMQRIKSYGYGLLWIEDMIKALELNDKSLELKKQIMGEKITWSICH